MQLNREELAWAAGLFDGEGTAVAQIRPMTLNSDGSRRKSAQRGFAMAVSQAGDYAPALMRRFQCAVLGMGGVYRVHGKKRAEYYKEGWCWRSSKFEHIQAVTALLWPWLSTAKRLQLKKALRTFLSWPRLKDLMTAERGREMAAKRWGQSA